MYMPTQHNCNLLGVGLPTHQTASCWIRRMLGTPHDCADRRWRDPKIPQFRKSVMALAAPALSQPTTGTRKNKKRFPTIRKSKNRFRLFPPCEVQVDVCFLGKSRN